MICKTQSIKLYFEEQQLLLQARVKAYENRRRVQQYTK